MAIDFDNVLIIWEICIFQFNLSSINKPKNVMLLLHSIRLLIIVIFYLIDESEFLILNRIAVDFCIFIDNLFIHSNSYNISRYSCIICSRSIILSFLKIRFVSSENNIILTLLEIFVMSLI